jgi:hypothetical protein
VPVQYFFRGCIVIVDAANRYVETRFADGCSIGSTPNDDPHTFDVAVDLGYGDDTWTMSRDHELAHTWLAHVEGLDWSATMWRLAHPHLVGSLGDVEVSEEETRVLDFQRLIDKTVTRPWDRGEIAVVDELPW